MLSAIFTPEIDTLQSEIQRMQDTIAVAQARIEALGEIESVADGAIQALQFVLQKVSSLAPNAIACFKSTVLSLFEGDDNFGDDDGDSPQDPIPDAPSGGDELPQPLEIIPGSIRPSPSFPRSELASLLEDAPESVLVGQSFELACTKDDKRESFVQMIQVNPVVAYQRRHDGEIISVYVGSNNKQKLRNWGDWLTRTHSVTHGYQLREAERLSARWEIKLTPMTLPQIEKLALCDFSKEPRSGCFSIQSPKPERVPSVAEITGIGVGDIVRSLTVKHWEFRVIANVGEEFFECERLGTNPVITQTLHLDSIELVSKECGDKKLSQPHDNTDISWRNKNHPKGVGLISQALPPKAALEVVTTVAADDVEERARQALDSIQPPYEQQFAYSLLESSNLDQKWSVSRLQPDGTHQFLGSVSCGTNMQRWSHSRQPRHGRNIPCFQSKELAAAELAKVFDQSHPPRQLASAGIEIDF